MFGMSLLLFKLKQSKTVLPKQIKKFTFELIICQIHFSLGVVMHLRNFEYLIASNLEGLNEAKAIL